MSNIKEQGKQLASLQMLCLQVEQDNAEIQAFLKQLKVAEKRRKQLTEAYHQDWQALAKLPQETLAQIQVEVPEGHYSVLAEDTIWDALETGRQARVALLKLLVKQID